ncbi:MAG: glycosyltransferase [Candidatus Omnitrophica bacterium]|nr:glycosyltransferase [Candidatus Omnitrophota bacterium]
MKIAAVYSIYNEEDYIEYSIRSIYDFVDKIVISLGQAPYIAYNPKARQTVTERDRTKEIVQRLAHKDNKFHIIEGLWSSETEHRNAGMKYCLENDFDYYLLIDADEVYRKDHLQAVSKRIAANPQVGTFVIRCPIFWRSFKYRIPPQRIAWCPRRIFKITRKRNILGIKLPYDCRFIGENKTNSLGEVMHIPPEEAVFYHFSYAKTPKVMKEKLSTFSHAHEILDGWYDNVWSRWSPNSDMRNIHPTEPTKFPAAEYREPDDLPEVMKSHPYYNMEVIE